VLIVILQIISSNSSQEKIKLRGMFLDINNLAIRFIPPTMESEYSNVTLARGPKVFKGEGGNNNRFG